ncbi:MAG: hypothetical protein P9L94_18825 [Candidatus Hinthialibacter antarcticus]|nr:hypothetical protein [Candidatus Hinthialibacter antarcticus]
MTNGCPFEPSKIQQLIRLWAIRLGLLFFLLFWPAMWFMRVAGIAGWLDAETSGGALARFCYSIVHFPLTLPPYSLTPMAGAVKYLFLGFLLGLVIDWVRSKCQTAPEGRDEVSDIKENGAE